MRCYYPLVGYTPTDVPRPDQYGRLKSCKNSSGPLGSSSGNPLEGPTGPTGPGLEIFGATGYGQYLLYDGATWGVAGNPISLGISSGQFSQGTNAVAIGYQAGRTGQGSYSIAIGWNAGGGSQSSQSIAIGSRAGNTNQGGYAVAIGDVSAILNQGVNSVAIGPNSASYNQGIEAVAIGYAAGQYSQGNHGIAIGFESGRTNQGTFSVAIGYNAQNNGCTGSVALGYNATCTQSNTIVFGTTAETAVFPGTITPSTVVSPSTSSLNLGGIYNMPAPGGGWPTTVTGGVTLAVGTFVIDNVSLPYGTYLLVASIPVLTASGVNNFVTLSVSNTSSGLISSGNNGDYINALAFTGSLDSSVTLTRIIQQYATSINPSTYYINLKANVPNVFPNNWYVSMSGWSVTLTRIA